MAAAGGSDCPTSLQIRTGTGKNTTQMLLHNRDGCLDRGSQKAPAAHPLVGLGSGGFSVKV